jgi:alanyl-tRNA synthetase
VNEDQAIEAAERLHSESKRLARELTQLKTKIAMGGGGSNMAHGGTGSPGGSGNPGNNDTIEVAGVRLLRRKVTDLEKDALRTLTDSLKAQLTSGVIVIACVNDGKVQVVVSVTADLTARVKAGQIVKELAPIVGGGGGGRPDFAEAGGKQPEKIDEMLAAAEGVISKLLSTS